MSYQVSALGAELTHRLRRFPIWILLVVIPLLSLGVRRMAAEPEAVSARVTVGVVLQEDGGETFWKGLERRGGQTIQFLLTDEETLYRNVAVSQWDCGLILSPEYEEMLEDADLDEAVTLVTGPGSTVYPLVRETVAAVLCEQVSPHIARRYLLGSGILSEEDIPSVEARLAEILPETQRVGIVLETLDGRTLSQSDLAEDGLMHTVRGSLAILLLVWAMYTIIDLSRWMETAAAQRMLAVRSRVELMLPRLLSTLIIMFFAGAAALVTAFGAEGLRSMAALVPYLAVLGAAALLLGGFRGAAVTVPVVIPVIVAACFVLCPVFVDVSLFVPQLKTVTGWIPVTLYLNACDADGGAVWTLWGMAAGLGAAAAVRSRT